MSVLDEEETAAMKLLIDVAKSDTGQARRCADFLLAWWNAGTCGKFDLTELWGLDTKLSEAMVVLFRFVSKNQGVYPNQLGYEPDFLRIISEWRPELDED